MKALIAVIALATMLAGLTAAQAGDYPSRPITIIVPFAAGGPSDVMARILADPDEDDARADCASRERYWR
jgi:tripartite-type tricarboxylate transporter receptor subunit TctC